MNNQVTKAIKNFLSQYKKEENYIGSMLVGSYATNNNNEFSDVDIYIIVNDPNNKFRRGCREVDNFWFEYFIANVDQVKNQIVHELEQNKKVTARKFITGKILECSKNDIIDLISYSKEFMLEDFKKPDLNWVLEKKSSVFLRLDELRCSENTHNFYFVYFNSLMDIANIRNIFLQEELIHKTKILKIYEDQEFRKKYGMKITNDVKYIEMFIKCVNFPTYKNIEEISFYVLGKMGDFEEFEITKTVF